MSTRTKIAIASCVGTIMITASQTIPKPNYDDYRKSYLGSTKIIKQKKTEYLS